MVNLALGVRADFSGFWAGISSGSAAIIVSTSKTRFMLFFPRLASRGHCIVDASSNGWRFYTEQHHDANEIDAGGTGRDPDTCRHKLRPAETAGRRESLARSRICARRARAAEAPPFLAGES